MLVFLNFGFLDFSSDGRVFGIFQDGSAVSSSHFDRRIVEIKSLKSQNTLGGVEEFTVFAAGGGIFDGDEADLPPEPMDESSVFAYQENPFFPEGEDVDGLGLKNHVVQPGDTPSAIAKHYGISVDTILTANELRYGDYIAPGEVLIVLPVSGLIHKVQSGDSVQNLAEKYKAPFDEIIKYNLLAADGMNLPTGEYILIPGGQKYIPVAPPAYGQKLAEYSDYYVFPTTGRNWGRLHPVNGVDIANSCGTEIYAAASGKVVSVASTNSASPSANGGYGSNIVILHDNGTKTRYAHLLAALVQAGDEVSKGSLIAWMGGRPYTPGAGRSTGCHLHFEVTGAKNPFIRY